MARTTKKQQEERKRRIIEVASKKFLEHGFEATSTKTIAKEVGIAEGTLFNYFDSKTDLFFEIINQDIQQKMTVWHDTIKEEKDIAKAIVTEMKRILKLLLKLPKRLLAELTVQTIKLAKKNPSKLKHYADIDFQYMARIEEYFNQLKARGFFQSLNSKYMSEIIYSIMVYELMIYVYDKKRSKEMLFNTVEDKVYMVLKERL
ncbi:MAG: TetR/AcrR family transcriptional regulator [Candidatus Izemoplasma sp.]|nr:TetR/AcrR family transcriptional regulator [Candidatus Izemoplasma sp.]